MGEGTRTPDIQIHSLTADRRKDLQDTTSGGGGGPVAHQLPGVAPEAPADPDLARVVAAWPDLPPAIRAAVLALVNAAR